jgi:hypothetical protein
VAPRNGEQDSEQRPHGADPDRLQRRSPEENCRITAPVADAENPEREEHGGHERRREQHARHRKGQHGERHAREGQERRIDVVVLFVGSDGGERWVGRATVEDVPASGPEGVKVEQVADDEEEPEEHEPDGSQRDDGARSGAAAPRSRSNG